ncbi:unnamed protein product [Eruca vesicaria subsp. sativa]|uniref:Uncharacterized protein n=1 Tax=Eruca vesicaria subsp. sativa TaxID=29727 RepID=A0ABC8IX04_ERUVS|nr:unnamed protein product [Eruca vesicaria subsp. sativa]
MNRPVCWLSKNSQLFFVATSPLLVGSFELDDFKPDYCQILALGVFNMAGGSKSSKRRDKKVSTAYDELVTSSKKTLASLLELQGALFEKNPSVDQQADGKATLTRSESNTSDGEDSYDEWHRISDIGLTLCLCVVECGAAAIKGKLHAFNQNVSEQVDSYMRDPSRMIKQMQQSTSTVAVFGTVPEEAMEPNQEEKQLEGGDPELVEDAEFYQQLIKEFFETIDPASSGIVTIKKTSLNRVFGCLKISILILAEAAFYAMKKFQTEKRKIVDRLASKSRKVRQIVNFMAPRRVKIPPNSADLLKNLFGLKTRNCLPEVL